jgi:lipopolysaccharide export system permease protein
MTTPINTLAPQSATYKASEAGEKRDKSLGYWLIGATLLDRYLLSQLLNYFLLGIIGLTMTLLFSDTLLDMLFDLQNYGMPFQIIITLVLLQIPKLVSVAIPMGVVLSTLLSYNNLQQHSELIPIRMSGISLYRVAAPALLLAVMATLLTYWLQNFVVPKCVAYTQTLRALALTEYALPLKQANFAYKQFDDAQHLQRLIYVNMVENKSLTGVIAIDLTHPGTLQVTQAKSGVWTGENIHLKQASIYTLATNGNLTNTSVAQDLQLDDFVRRPQFNVRIKPQDQSIQALQSELRKSVEHHQDIAPKLWMTYWSKYFFPLTVIPLALMSIPLVIVPPRRSNQVGFVLTIVVTFLYYVLEHSIGQIGSQAMLPPVVAATLPVLLISIVSAVLLTRKNVSLA